MQLWIGNFAPGTTDDELRELVGKYTKLAVSRVRREDGDGSQPGAALEFDEATRAELHEAERRLNGMFWKDRTLRVYLPLG
ncbi:MAG: RNA recognition motif domain-containing protein [Burkholderiales bacterium]